MRHRRKQKIVTSIVFVALFATVVAIAAQDQRNPFQEIDQQLQPLKKKFSDDIGKVRVLVIGDPTCPPCRRGAAAIQESVVSKFATSQLAVYVVWVPLLNLQDPATLQRHAHQYAGLIPPEPRVTHYSDPEAYVAKTYGPIVGVPYGAPAWDVYFVFDPKVRWDDAPPKPNYWQHQLGGLPHDKYLDGPRFAQEIRKLLAGK